MLSFFIDQTLTRPKATAIISTTLVCRKPISIVQFTQKNIFFMNILTEIIGGPTPVRIPVIADKQLPQGDWPMPVAPQEWHYRQSIDYEMTQNRAIMDLASRYRE